MDHNVSRFARENPGSFLAASAAAGFAAARFFRAGADHRNEPRESGDDQSTGSSETAGSIETTGAMNVHTTDPDIRRGTAEHDPNAIDLLGRLTRQGAHLAEEQVHLMQAEVSEATNDIKQAVGAMAGAAVVGIAGLGVLLMGFAYLLGDLIESTGDPRCHSLFQRQEEDERQPPQARTFYPHGRGHAGCRDRRHEHDRRPQMTDTRTRNPDEIERDIRETQRDMRMGLTFQVIATHKEGCGHAAAASFRYRQRRAMRNRISGQKTVFAKSTSECIGSNGLTDR